MGSMTMGSKTMGSKTRGLTMRDIKASYGACLAAIERELHRNPEVAFREFNTTRIVSDELRSIGFEIIEMELETGVVARLNTGKNGPVIGLRADIDGIEQQEAVDRPDKSVNDGVMHACGHDVHTVGLLGAAMALADARDSLSGDVVVIFQPAEETIAGARRLISRGLFEKAPLSALFGLHNTPDLMVGQIGLRRGTLMSAKDDFRIIVSGVGGHGAFPHLCIDPIVASCAIVEALQSIVSRNVSPQDTAVISVCSIHGGSASNLIPNEVYMTGNTRTFDTAVQEMVIRRLKETVANTAAAYGCTAEVEHNAAAPPLVNSDVLYDIARTAAGMTVAAEHIREVPVCFASEDFALYGEFVPAFFYFLGSGTEGGLNAPWHNARFQAHPDTAFWGAKLLVNSVLAAQG